MLRIIPALIAIIAAVAVLACEAAASPYVPVDSPTTGRTAPETRCLEDEPCWRWSTMGNRKRGIISVRSGRRVIVGPCRFARMRMRGAIDWRRTPHIRGDLYAIRYGCGQ